MKSCSYCGRDNADDTKNCRECGTEFAAQPEGSPPEAAAQTLEIPIVEPPVEAPTTDLSELDMGFEVVEGFSRPDWKGINEFVKARVPKLDLTAAWNYITSQWLAELAGDLGGRAGIYRSHDFHCLSDLEPQRVRGLLAYAELAEATVRSYLGKAAGSGYLGKHVLLVFADPDDYYAYISHFCTDGKHILSGGVLIQRGYAHIVLPYIDPISVQQVLVHELTHDLLGHLPLPLWLNEGLAVMSESLVGQRRFMVTRELADRHRKHWTETNLQAFWAGTTFDVPGDDSELSYSLGEILVHLLAEKGPGFGEFVGAADWRDGGHEAAVTFLNQGLEEAVGGFLGPGNWRPQRKAIKEHLQAAKGK